METWSACDRAGELATEATMEESGAASKLCDSCRASRALLYCRADSAFLCGGCDTRVHGANGLSSRHTRSWLCEACEHAPATVTCQADAASLCAACDADIHSANPLARRHERLPLLPFLGPAPLPTAARVRSAAYSLRPSVEEEEVPVLRSAEEFLFTDADAFLDLDYEIKNVVEEGPSVLLSPDGGYFDLNVAGAKPEPDASFFLSESSDVAVVPNMSKTLPMAGIRCDPAVARAERTARLVRYREKRKNRRFEKTIRYATRKAYAEARPRIKGRFVKRAEVETEVDRIYSSAAEAVAALMAEDEYGVVPSC